MNITKVFFIGSILLIMGLTNCGQMGSLYLPKHHQVESPSKH